MPSPAPADSLQERLRDLHECVRTRFPSVERVAAALYDPGTDLLRTFVHSTSGEPPLLRYEAPLARVPSLGSLAAGDDERVVEDLETFRGSPTEHSRRLLEAGYRSSYTMCLRENGQLQGFLFFDSRRPRYFTREVYGVSQRLPWHPAGPRR